MLDVVKFCPLDRVCLQTCLHPFFTHSHEIDSGGFLGGFFSDPAPVSPYIPVVPSRFEALPRGMFATSLYRFPSWNPNRLSPFPSSAFSDIFA